MRGSFPPPAPSRHEMPRFSAELVDAFNNTGSAYKKKKTPIRWQTRTRPSLTTLVVPRTDEKTPLQRGFLFPRC
jgi:hypothetical protein